ncbi:hypothetical protein HJC23_004034 [Cyclotella cryptica]|uniref:Uncharacterized protein n=1 Tax=Cyclotella cryptica TaxID=29204 RepID=A0ABD3QUP7_9STRA
MCDQKNSAASLFAWLGFTSIALIHRSIHLYFYHETEGETHVEHSRRVAQNDSGAESDCDPWQQQQQQGNYFPWEPRISIDDISKNESSSTSEPLHRDTRQLEFLSSMTFANQSLRQPSCPCCR